MLEFSISNQLISRLDPAVVVSDSENYLECAFQFSEDWEGVTAVAVFGHRDVAEPVAVPIVAGRCQVPEEVIHPWGFTLAVYGSGGSAAEGYTHIPTGTVTVEVEASGVSQGLHVPEPTADLYDALMEALRECESSAAMSKTSAAAAANAAQSAARGAGEDAQRAEYSAQTGAQSALEAMEYAQTASRGAAQAVQVTGELEEMSRRAENLLVLLKSYAVGTAEYAQTAALRGLTWRNGRTEAPALMLEEERRYLAEVNGVRFEGVSRLAPEALEEARGELAGHHRDDEEVLEPNPEAPGEEVIVPGVEEVFPYTKAVRLEVGPVTILELRAVDAAQGKCILTTGDESVESVVLVTDGRDNGRYFMEEARSAADNAQGAAQAARQGAERAENARESAYRAQVWAEGEPWVTRPIDAHMDEGALTVFTPPHGGNSKYWYTPLEGATYQFTVTHGDVTETATAVCREGKVSALGVEFEENSLVNRSGYAVDVTIRQVPVLSEGSRSAKAWAQQAAEDGSAVEQAARTAQENARVAETCAAHPPVVENGTWWTWDPYLEKRPMAPEVWEQFLEGARDYYYFGVMNDHMEALTLDDVRDVLFLRADLDGHEFSSKEELIDGTGWDPVARCVSLFLDFGRGSEFTDNYGLTWLKYPTWEEFQYALIHYLYCEGTVHAPTYEESMAEAKAYYRWRYPEAPGAYVDTGIRTSVVVSGSCGAGAEVLTGAGTVSIGAHDAAHIILCDMERNTPAVDVADVSTVVLTLPEGYRWKLAEHSMVTATLYLADGTVRVVPMGLNSLAADGNVLEGVFDLPQSSCQVSALALDVLAGAQRI